MSTKPVILWAEDDDNDALLMERALTKAAVAAECIRVEDGVQATKYLAGEGIYGDRQQFPLPQLLVLDIKMPRMTGFEVLQWKQHRPELDQLSAVMLSASEQESDVQKAFGLGAKAYFVKPVTMDALVQQVKQLEKVWLSQAA